MTKTNKAQILIGLAALLLGTLVYLVDRPGDQSLVRPSVDVVVGDLDIIDNLEIQGKIPVTLEGNC